MNTVIVKPIITERALQDAGKGVFTFEVEKDASKKDIKEMIEKLFKVHVVGVTTSIGKGKTKRVGKKRLVKDLPKRKKARITLKKGEKIEYFEVKKS